MLAQAIRAIGDAEFAGVAARCALDYAGFEWAVVIVHPRRRAPLLMFDNFASIGGRRGIENYVAVTHAINPILRFATTSVSVLRARDFPGRVNSFSASMEPYLVRSPDEEMGFRTLGWPEKLEEIGLYFAACDGVIELSLYRERGRRRAGADALDQLRALGAPLAAAFDTHARVAAQANRAATSLLARLSPREAQITELLLRGCGSRAISLRLDISVHTVKDHRKRIFRKLGVGTLAQLFALHVAPPLRRDSPGPRAASR